MNRHLTCYQDLQTPAPGVWGPEVGPGPGGGGQVRPGRQVLRHPLQDLEEGEEEDPGPGGDEELLGAAAWAAGAAGGGGHLLL